MSDRGTTPSRPAPTTLVATLLPTGTARAWFLGAAASEPSEPVPADLGTLLAARDVPPADVLAAWEVAAVGGGAPLPERNALACLVVALLDAEAKRRHRSCPSVSRHAPDAPGATRPMPPLGPTRWRGRSSRAPPRRPWRVSSVLRERGGHSFWMTAGLQSERLWAMENEVATLLARRLSARGAGLAPPDAVRSRAGGSRVGAGGSTDLRRAARRPARRFVGRADADRGRSGHRKDVDRRSRSCASSAAWASRRTRSPSPPPPAGPRNA
jgi:hypothetical protein